MANNQVNIDVWVSDDTNIQMETALQGAPYPHHLHVGGVDFYLTDDSLRALHSTLGSAVLGLAVEAEEGR